MFERKHAGPDQLGHIAGELMASFPGSRVFAFYGAMGSGKTTFIREICRVLHSPDTVTSPSFAIINEYGTPGGDSIYHFDFYRIKGMDEVFDLGYEDYFFSGSYCLIEWPEKVRLLLPANHVEVTISEDGDQTRHIIAKGIA